MVEDGTALMPDTQDRDRPDLDRLFPQGQHRYHADAGQPPGHGQRRPRGRGYRRDPDRRHQGRAGDPHRRRRHRHLPGQQGGRRGLELHGLDGQSDEAQIEIVAKGGNVLARPDLANNKYSAADPRLVLFNTIAAKGQTPFAKNFGATFNDPQGPWLVLLRDAVFGDASKIDADNEAINASLNP